MFDCVYLFIGAPCCPFDDDRECSFDCPLYVSANSQKGEEILSTGEDLDEEVFR